VKHPELVQPCDAFEQLRKRQSQPLHVELLGPRAARIRSGRAQPVFALGGELEGGEHLVSLAATDADVRENVRSVEKLHGEEPVALVLGELVQGDQVRVRDVCERAKLLLERDQGVRRDPLQRLEGDGPAELHVERLVHDAEAPDADAPHELVSRRPSKLTEVCRPA
jgi:hypothetical protein